MSAARATPAPGWTEIVAVALGHFTAHRPFLFPCSQRPTNTR